MAGTTAPRAANATVTINMIEVLTEDDAYALAEALQRLNHLATHADTTATALRIRIINQLRQEGLDGNNTGLRGLLTGGDATRTASKAVQPLRAISADMENAARNAHVFRNRIQSLVFDPIRAARQMKTSGTAGLVVR